MIKAVDPTDTFINRTLSNILYDSVNVEYPGAIDQTKYGIARQNESTRLPEESCYNCSNITRGVDQLDNMFLENLLINLTQVTVY